MHDSSASYHRLGRTSSSSGFSRNILFFIILVALTIFGSLFYLYNSTSNELATLREELASQNTYVSKLKNEVLEINVNLEKSRTAESECKNAKSTAETKLTECTDELEKKKSALTDLEGTKTKSEDSMKELQTKVDEYKALLENQKTNMSAMQEVGVNQEAIVIKLNETVQLLQKDLILKDEIIHKLKAQLNSSSSSASVNSPASVNLSASVNSSTSLNSSTNLTQIAEQSVQNQTNSNVTDVKSNFLSHAEIPKNKEDQDDEQSNAGNIPEPKTLTEHAPILTSNKNAAENDEHRSKEMLGGLGDVIVNREPGARVKIEEVKEEQEKKDQGAPLIDVAEKQDKEDEKDQEIKQSNDFN
uniref:Uncharacterized protein n=1 Tax=Acrobeloides nanus TaxID=290746 RepID=A0A914CCJ2_9BILA